MVHLYTTGAFLLPLFYPRNVISMRGGLGGRSTDCGANTGSQGSKVRVSVHPHTKSHIFDALHSGTRLSTILDAVPEVDIKLNFPQVVGISHVASVDYDRSQ